MSCSLRFLLPAMIVAIPVAALAQSHRVSIPMWARP